MSTTPAKATKKSKTAKSTTKAATTAKATKVKATPKAATKATPAPKATTTKAAATPKAKKVSGPVIEILSAQYGIDGTRVEMASVKVGRKLTNKMAGSDPAPKTPKNALITATVDGNKVEKTFTEGEVINF